MAAELADDTMGIRAKDTIKVDKNTAYPFTPPRLVDYSGDLSKDWYIVYYIWNIDRKKKVRKRDSSFNNFTSEYGRRKAADKIIRTLNDILEKGAYTYDKDPDEDKNEIASLSLSKAISLCLDVRHTKVKKNSTKMGTTLAKRIIEWQNLENCELNLLEFNKGRVQRFMNWLKVKYNLSNQTYNNYRSELSAVFRHFQAEYPDIITDNPVLEVEILRKRKGGLHVPYTQEQLRKIKERALELSQSATPVRRKRYGQYLTFIHFLYYTFIRPDEELRMLKVTHIKERTIFIPPEISKDPSGEHVVIPPPLEKIIREKKLREYPSGYYIFSKNGTPGPDPVYRGHFYQLNKAILKDLGYTYDDFTLYSYKHTGVIALFNAGADIKSIQRQCRHSSIEMTDRYMKHLGLIRNEDLNFFPEFGK